MLIAIFFAVLLLVIGVVLRVTLKPLQWIFVPASIVGGLVGLAVAQADWFTEASLFDGNAVLQELSSWPGTLIAVVFACMFLQRPGRPLRQSLRLASREGIVVWIIVLGQTAIGLVCTWLLIQPFFDVPNSFAMLIETGFAGGHGTAAAMGTVFESDAIGLDNGLDLGLFMATVGLVFSVVSGVIYVNLAIRLGWLGRAEKVELVQGLETRHAPQPIALGRIRPEVVDPLVFQFLIVASAFGLGYAMQQAVSYAVAPTRVETVAAEESEEIAAMVGEDADGDATDGLPGASPSEVGAAIGADAASGELLKRVSLAGTVGGMPLFIYTLFGGLIVRQVLSWFRIGDLIDPGSIERISGCAMEFLIVAAIATLRLEAIAGVAIPLAILVLAAFVWTGFCLLVIARKLLPSDYWFQLGILNYGMSTGTTATGFTLLKIVDKDLESGASEDYALAAPLSSPFIGGGMLTVGLPLLVLENVHIGVSAICLSTVVVALYFLGRWLAR